MRALFQISREGERKRDREKEEKGKKNRQEIGRERETGMPVFSIEADLWLFDVRSRRVQCQGTLWEEKAHQSALIGQIYLVSGRAKPKEGDLLEIMRDKDGQSVSNKAGVSKNTQKQDSSLS